MGDSVVERVRHAASGPSLSEEKNRVFGKKVAQRPQVVWHYVK